MLVRQLPADSATVRAQTVEAEWSTTDYLLAAVLDAVRHGNWMTVELNKKKGARNPAPQPVRRPGDPEPRQKMTGFDLVGWLKTKVG